ncbi:patatin family protein [Lachnospiraceae bacterium]|jgi:predicted patatin/cPLA2 family phospholipase|nr:patatin family protein [uncultured Schaedlerella sp.]MCI9153294.1 patatin family protein [Ruminococcus sp.]NBI58555.1 patatin family protein [Lachnospiraceae bacterium]
MQKATMILEGGATRGVFTSGVLDYLMEQELYMSHVIGVSAGSCNAVDYVSRQPGRTRDCMILTDKKENYVHGFRSLVREKSVMNMDMIFDTFPNETHPFDYETYFQSEMKCEIVVTNCLTGKAEYLDERQDKARLMKLCRASCSMPLLTPVVRVDGIPCLDGGLADSVPIERAMTYGNQKIVVILTRNPGYRKKRVSKGMARVYREAYRSYPNLLRAIMTRSLYYNRTMEQIERLEEKGRIFVLRPQVKAVSRLERNAEILTGFYEHGYHLMEREYTRLTEYLEG